MRNAPIVQGVPTPYALHVHPYPTRFHGAIYTRPVFGFPQNARPQDVFTPGYNISRSAPQPPISGLGSEESSMWNVGDGVFKPGGYGGGVFDGDISGLGTLAPPRKKARRIQVGPNRTLRGLGDDSSDYPWGQKSDKTTALQQSTNQLLAEAAMCPIAVDGKLGKATCGARRYLTANSQRLFGQNMNVANPSTCQGYTDPSPLTSGCGSGGAKPSAPVTSPSTVPTLPVMDAGMSSSTKRALGFGLGAVLAVGAVVLLRKKRG